MVGGRVSRAIDSKGGQAGSLLEVLERRVGLEGLTKRGRTRGTEVVVIEAANVRQSCCQRLLTARLGC